MNILVCVKQVPDTTEIKIDPVTNTLIRDGVPAIVNTFDSFALDAALKMKEKDPETRVTVISMGPENAKKALKECLALGADQAYLVSARAFGGSDTLATSYILSNAVKKTEEAEGKYDAIFCGKQAIDGDTAQVGPELAEHLGYPQITCALTCEGKNGCLEVLKEGQDAQYLLEVGVPAVITFTKPVDYTPRYPSIKSKMKANRTEIPVLTDEDFTEINRDMIGLKGSPTNVKRSFVPIRNKSGLKLEGLEPQEAGKRLARFLADAGIL